MRVPAPLAQLGFNQRFLTWRDYDALLDKEGIVYLHVPLEVPGFYAIIDDCPCIGVNEVLKSPEIKAVSWHEMGHHFLHSPELHLYGNPNRSKTEFQAHVIAACALIPQYIIRTTEFAEIEEALNLSHDFVLFRARVWQSLRW